MFCKDEQNISLVLLFLLAAQSQTKMYHFHGVPFLRISALFFAEKKGDIPTLYSPDLEGIKKRGNRFIPASSQKGLFVTQRDKRHPCQDRRWGRPNLRERPPKACRGLRHCRGRRARGHRHSRRYRRHISCSNSPLFSAAEPLGEDCHDLIVAAAAAGRAAGQLLYLGKLLLHIGEVRAPL